MKTMHLFSSLALLLGTVLSQAQPQWRFHLAFEDAIGAKDTIWFVYDTSATQAMDHHLGEVFVHVDPDSFNVWMSSTFNGDTAVKSLALPFTDYPQGYFPITGNGYTPPLTLRWDPSLFSSPDLPSTPASYIRYAGLFSYYWWVTDTWNLGTEGFDMMLTDSVVIEAGFEEWLFTPYLSMAFDFIDYSGIDSRTPSLPSLEVFPNPTKDRMVINAPEALTEVLLLDALGRAVMRVAPPDIGPVEVDVSGLPAGSYLLHARGRGGMYRGRVVVE